MNSDYEWIIVFQLCINSIYGNSHLQLATLQDPKLK